MGLWPQGYVIALTIDTHQSDVSLTGLILGEPASVCKSHPSFFLKETHLQHFESDPLAIQLCYSGVCIILHALSFADDAP